MLQFLLTPLREGRHAEHKRDTAAVYFYSRPCGRGDSLPRATPYKAFSFLLTPLREGRRIPNSEPRVRTRFLLTPLREGRPLLTGWSASIATFLLTPLREGRLGMPRAIVIPNDISTHAPAGGATPAPVPMAALGSDFYSRPCGRGDGIAPQHPCCTGVFLLTPLREGRPRETATEHDARAISTHAPAGGATSLHLV